MAELYQSVGLTPPEAAPRKTLRLRAPGTRARRPSPGSGDQKPRTHKRRS
jgi:hypothetical protein